MCICHFISYQTGVAEEESTSRLMPGVASSSSTASELSLTTAMLRGESPYTLHAFTLASYSTSRRITLRLEGLWVGETGLTDIFSLVILHFLNNV